MIKTNWKFWKKKKTEPRIWSTMTIKNTIIEIDGPFILSESAVVTNCFIYIKKPVETAIIVKGQGVLITNNTIYSENPDSKTD